MTYDKAYVALWREKAITKLEDLHVGKTYYSNCSELRCFKVKELLTNKQADKRHGLKSTNPDTANTINWFTVTDQQSHRDTYSLRDRNIGASYNPWLIFAREADMEEYKAGLKVTYSVHSKEESL